MLLFPSITDYKEQENKLIQTTCTLNDTIIKVLYIQVGLMRQFYFICFIQCSTQYIYTATIHNIKIFYPKKNTKSLTLAMIIEACEQTNGRQKVHRGTTHTVSSSGLRALNSLNASLDEQRTRGVENCARDNMMRVWRLLRKKNKEYVREMNHDRRYTSLCTR